MLFAPWINIIFDISMSNNVGISNICAKIAGNRRRTSGKYLHFPVWLEENCCNQSLPWFLSMHPHWQNEKYADYHFILNHSDTKYFCSSQTLKKYFTYLDGFLANWNPNNWFQNGSLGAMSSSPTNFCNSGLSLMLLRSLAPAPIIPVRQKHLFIYIHPITMLKTQKPRRHRPIS